MKYPVQMALVTAISGFLLGCATAPPATGQDEKKPIPVPAAPYEPTVKPAPPSPPPVAKQADVPVVVAPELTVAEKGLANGLASFDRGEYVAAMRLLTPLTNDQSLNLPSRLKALKTLAFSQCLTGAVVACRGTFERAFKLDPKFDLAPAEQGHPVWGPQFDRARKNLKIK